MAYISSLKLHNFRCYTEVRMDDLAPGFVVLSGSNGAGKTNVLEALSLLSPGRGMRGAKVMEIQRVPHPVGAVAPPFPLPEGRGIKGEGSPWAMAAHLGGVSGSVQIGTGLEPLSEKRVIRINGEHVRTQAALADYLSCVWLTPQMDRLFMDSSSHRRRFLDRLVFAFDPGHAGRVNRYDNAMAQRSRLLREGRGDMTWLSGLEAQMAETGVALAAARREFVHLLQSAMGKGGDDYFPAARLESAGTIE
ncbi:MAG: AAA family ATPase, partial [Alphaproteobacteria bacterium]